MLAAVDTYLDARLPAVSQNYLVVLDERFKTIYDEPEHSPGRVATIEFEIFIKQVEELSEKLRVEAQDHLHQWVEVAKTVGVYDMLNQHIHNRIFEACQTLLSDAAQKLSEVVANVDPGSSASH